LSSVLSLFAMPMKVNPRNKVGTIICTVSNRVLSDHITKNNSNVNYAKHFMQGTIVDVFDGRAPGRKNVVWKLTVYFKVLSNEPVLGVKLKRVAAHSQHCIFGPVPAGKNPPCSITFTELIGAPGHTAKGSTTYLPNTKGRPATASAIASINNNADVNVAPCISLLPAPLIAATVEDEIKVILPPLSPPHPTDAMPTAVRKTKKKREKAMVPDNALTKTPPLPTAPTAKKSKATTKKKKATKPVDLRTTPMWVSMTNVKKHHVVTIAHKQKWVAGKTGTITGNITNEPSSNHQWSHKGLFGERITPGNPE
jgi:hypothetical protein